MKWAHKERQLIHKCLPGKEQMPRDWEHSTTDRDNLQNTHTTNHSQSMNISPAVEYVCACFVYHEIWKGGSVASTSAKSSSSDESNSLVLIAPVYHRHKCNDTKIIINPDTDIYMRAQCGTAIQTAACSDAFAYHVGVTEKCRWFHCKCMKK